MKTSPLVTIALSAYNVSEYINAALDCIERQTYRNIEILCIDDCSTDGTFERICQHASADSRYRIIRQNTNQGLSVSRNRAIEEANGEYIIMLDGDDLFSHEMVEKALSAAMKSSADMVLWDYITFENETEIIKKAGQPSSLSHISYTDKIELLKRPAFMWVRMLKLSTLRKLNIYFTPGLTKQDIPIHWQLIITLDSIEILPERLSYYRQQQGATSCRKGRSVFSLAYVMDITEKFLKHSNNYDRFKTEFLRSRLSLLHGMYDFIKPELKDEALAMVKERYDSEAKSYIKSLDCRLSQRVRYFYGALEGHAIDCLKYKSILLARKVYRAIKH